MKTLKKFYDSFFVTLKSDYTSHFLWTNSNIWLNCVLYAVLVMLKYNNEATTIAKVISSKTCTLELPLP